MILQLLKLVRYLSETSPRLLKLFYVVLSEPFYIFLQCPLVQKYELKQFYLILNKWIFMGHKKLKILKLNKFMLGDYR